MKGYRFYLVYDDPREARKATRKNPGNHTGNVIAIFTENRPFYSRGDFLRECFAPVFFQTDSPVAGDSASLDYLRENCKNVSEGLARQIHPKMFERLDSSD